MESLISYFSNYLPLNGKEIAIKSLGNYPNRPTIIFLHDSLGCIELWRDFPQKLGEIIQCNILIYDRQGYGKSCEFSYDKRRNDYLEKEADILNQLLAHWNIEHPILFGHSDGGSIALIMAGKYPTRISGIITEGAHIFVENITIKGIKEAIQLYQTTNLKTKLEKYHGHKTEAMFWAWAATWTRPEYRKWNIERFLPSIQCPSLIIQGELDEYGTLEQVERIVSQAGGQPSKWVIPRVGHSPHKEVPELMLERVAEFVRLEID